ncbi:hyalin-like [Anneissia japonica]|uniref:hyalin-like n=1 Tax=Anneissia japonica TaxID=1529436 RepID=UPI001425B06A|nr:hyalin-like [Anneissia japonica]
MFSGIYIAVVILVSADTATCYSCGPTTHGLELVSLLKRAFQSTTRSAGGAAGRAVDGTISGTFSEDSCTHTENRPNQWWYLDLGSSIAISRIVIYNRNDCCAKRLVGAVVGVGNSNYPPSAQNAQCGTPITNGMISTSRAIEITCRPVIEGRYVSVYLPKTEYLTLCEVEVYKDIQNPVIMCPDDFVVNAVNRYITYPVAWNNPIVMDNIDTGLVSTCTPPSGSSFGIGLTAVTCTATDTTGNVGNCTFVVNVSDDEEPALLCPQHIVVNSSVDQLDNPVTWKPLTVIDNVHTGMSANCTPASGSFFDVGSTIVTCSATDGTGNEGSCSFVVHVTGQNFISDYEEPDLMCPHHIVVNNSVDQSENPVTWKEPTVADNVHSGISATCTPASGSFFEVGLTVVTCSATDVPGNKGSCSFVVHVTGQEYFSANTRSGNELEDTTGYLIAVVFLSVLVVVLMSALVLVCRHYKNKYKYSTNGLHMKMEDDNMD